MDNASEAPLTIPPPAAVREQLTQALRRVQLLRGLLRLSERAEGYRADGRRARRGREVRRGQ
jgi:hypothetical protein